MSKKQSKNLQRVQDMLDDKHERKIQSGYLPTEETHKVGDVWTDSDGKKWEQKNGYRVNISFQAFAWFLASLSRPGTELPEQLEFWHAGRCGRCGRRLTVPASIASGFGPECAGRI